MNKEMNAQGNLLLRGGYVLDTLGETPRQRDVLIEDDRIVDVGEVGSPRGASIVDVSGGLLIPGFVNSHTHSQNNLTKGSGERWTLEVALSFGPALNRGRTAEDHYLSALLGAIEMLRSGTTSVYDLLIEYPRPTARGITSVLEAYSDVGIRAVVAPAVADTNILEFLRGLGAESGSLVPDTEDDAPASAREIIDVLSTLTQQRLRLPTNVQLALSPTIPIYCSDDLIVGMRDLAESWGCTLHSHLAESKFQAVSSVRAFGSSLVQRLARLDVLSEKFIGAHGVWLRRGEVGDLAASGSVIVHCPTSNFKLGSGVASVNLLHSSGVGLALGTDGCISSDNQNMFDALKASTFASRALTRQSDDWLGAAQALTMVWEGGARVMGLPGQLGKIAPGYLADISILDVNSINLVPMNNATHQLVYCETGEAIDTVIVAGRILVQKGRLLSIDESMVKERCREARERHRQGNLEAWDYANERARALEKTCARLAALEGDSDFVCVP